MRTAEIPETLIFDYSVRKKPHQKQKKKEKENWFSLR